MARYGKEHKQATRQRIVDTAARRLKSDGVDGSGVATLMADAGLTNGAFYAHFESKDALVASVVGDDLRLQCETIAALRPGRETLIAVVRQYLSAEHRDHPELGCASAALLDELARAGEQVRESYTTGIVDIADALAALRHPTSPAKSRVQALAAFAGMVGTLQMARAVTDPELSDSLLEQGIHQALHALGIRPT